MAATRDQQQYGSNDFSVSGSLKYSHVPIRRGVRNKRSGTQDEKCIGRNISHMCLGLYSRCRFILTNLYLKVLHFDILIQLKGTAHFLENVLGLIKGVCRINIPCLLIGTREQLMMICLFARIFLLESNLRLTTNR